MGHTAIIAGASGLVGRELTGLLLSSGNYEKVITLVRTSTGSKNDKLREIIVDYEHLEDCISCENMQGAHVFCALGTTIKKAGSQEQFRKVDHEYPLELGNLAKQYGAAAYAIVSAMGADPKSMFFYSRVKGDVEQGLRQLNLRTLHILRPSLILGQRIENRSGEKLAAAVMRLVEPLMIGGMRQYRAIEAKHIALAMMKAVNSDMTGTHVWTSDLIEELAAKA
ncbi:NAD-dependent epimerase/dehydratase family protein [Paenibacillus hexagrammi]|uniref:NAD-dependent epimerase/dehydratase family protein n=1 Tax=Paenibacillus hexagrammi TaxID=2908839 RepID=A0ABY3SH94_9BACL|nr:NAD-dependent epimerase/dehydratase family protein [Paenibacillus sp. YPD9-1]UJF32574.1 NAD-dependent epimerase/dehydratase family protein [Paenibacillus sp. YPD9-1]